MGTSFKQGKVEIAAYITENYRLDSKILDAGAGNGNASDRLPHTNMDAIEIFKPYIDKFNLKEKYDTVFHTDIRDFTPYNDYDLILMGDVLEHLTVDDAQKLLARINTDMLITVPWKYPQEAVNGNQAENHEQEDLTSAVMAKRYPDLTPIIILPMLGTYLKKRK